MCKCTEGCTLEQYKGSSCTYGATLRVSDIVEAQSEAQADG